LLSLASPISFLTLHFSSGVAGPSPPCRSRHRDRIGERSRQHRRRPLRGHPQPRPGGCRTWIRRGAAVALATAQFESGHNFLQIEPVHFPLGSEDWWALEELTDDMEMAAAAISEDVNIEAVIGNVFADD